MGEMLPSEDAASAAPNISAPSPLAPEAAWAHAELFEAVKEALFSLPARFTSDLVISGVLATDLFSFNSSLGATIEAQVVDGLNELREIWDPANRYTQYRFVRQSQQFPDVVLRNAVVPSDIIMGIELKGWYALAKEGEPSFRYRVTPNVCAPQDLLVVYPWALSRVVSGSPMLFFPYVESARYAAEYRNYYWYTRKGAGDKGIRLSSVNHFYPAKSEPISDVPRSDSGGNFGRFARTGLMGEYIERLFREELSGIPLRAWQQFFAIFDEKITEGDIARKIEQIARIFNQGGERSFSTELENHIQAFVSLLRES